LLFEDLGGALGFSLVDDDSLLNGLNDGGGFVDFLDDGLFEHFVEDSLLLFLVGLVAVGFMYNRYVNFLNMGDVLFVNNGLDVVVDVLLDDDWLMVLMNHLLMVLMDDVLLMFNEHVLVVFVDHVLVDLLQDGLGHVGLDLHSEIVLLNSLSFVDFFGLSLVLVFNDDGLLGDHFNDGSTLVLFGSTV